MSTRADLVIERLRSAEHDTREPLSGAIHEAIAVIEELERSAQLAAEAYERLLTDNNAQTHDNMVLRAKLHDVQRIATELREALGNA
jgi:hypothetical protein